MTVLLEGVCDQLAAAAERAATRRTLHNRRGRVTAMAAAGALSLGGAAAVAATIWQPQLGSDRIGHPSASTSAPTAAQLAHLGVLRRGASAADHGAQSTYALRWLNPSLHGVRVDYVRLLGIQPDGKGFVLVPVQYFVPTGTENALCLFSQDSEAGGMSCFTTEQLLSGQAIMATERVTMVKTTSGPLPAGSRPPVTMPDGSPGLVRPVATLAGGRFFGLVPDGVASVRVSNAIASVTVPVHDNFFQSPMPTDAAHAAQEPQPVDKPTFEWLDGSGAEMPKTPAAAAAAAPHDSLLATQALAHRLLRH